MQLTGLSQRVAGMILTRNHNAGDSEVRTHRTLEMDCPCLTNNQQSPWSLIKEVVSACKQNEWRGLLRRLTVKDTATPDMRP